jgi:hypothetical protein
VLRLDVKPIAVGIGHRFPGGPVHSVFKVLRATIVEPIYGD